MIYSAVRARRFPMEGHQLISYMKHVKTITQRKGSHVAIEYDGQFRLQRLPEGVAWDDFQYDLYEECQSYCESKRKRTQKPFRAGRRGENVPRFCFAFNKGNCSRTNCRYSHLCSKCKRPGHGLSTCRAESKSPSQPHQPTKYEPVSTGHVLPTLVKHSVLECMLQGYDCRSKTSLILGFESGFRINSSIDTDPRKGLYENHKSVNDNLSIVQTKLDKEKALGRIAGPYQNPPLSNMVFSPLCLVPKKEPGDFRLIHDLS